jgi:hypothetical protein
MNQEQKDAFMGALATHASAFVPCLTVQAAQNVIRDPKTYIPVMAAAVEADPVMGNTNMYTLAMWVKFYRSLKIDIDLQKVVSIGFREEQTALEVKPCIVVPENLSLQNVFNIFREFGSLVNMLNGGLIKTGDPVKITNEDRPDKLYILQFVHGPGSCTRFCGETAAMWREKNPTCLTLNEFLILFAFRRWMGYSWNLPYHVLCPGTKVNEDGTPCILVNEGNVVEMVKFTSVHSDRHTSSFVVELKS